MELDYEDLDIIPRDKNIGRPLDEDQTVENPESYDEEDEYSCYR